MNGPISDKAAIEFSRGFYDAIGAGKDIPFAYEEGCRRVDLAAPGTQFKSKLLRAGENFVATSDPEVQPGSQTPRVLTRPILIGLAVDLSDSMRANLRNDSGGAITRLEGFQRSLGQTIARMNRNLKAAAHNDDHPSVDVFGYCFVSFREACVTTSRPPC
jgi:hypothetical protein